MDANRNNTNVTSKDGGAIMLLASMPTLLSLLWLECFKAFTFLISLHTVFNH